MGNTFYTTIGGHIVSIPKNENKRFSLFLIFPGIPPFGGEWIKTCIPDYIYENFIVILSKEFNSLYSEVTGEAYGLLASNGITKIEYKSIFGFSGGGIRCQENILTEEWDTVGLIDPSCAEQFISVDFPEGMLMVYNADNWGGYPTIKALLPQVADKVAATHGYVESCSLSHLFIPTYFFTKLFC